MCQEDAYKRLKKAVLLILGVTACMGLSGERTGADLQRLLDEGKDIALSPGEIVELSETLTVKHKGQAIYTKDAKSLSEYGIIRHGSGSSGTLIEGFGIEGLVIRELILDGNRSEFREPQGKLTYEPMISLGGEGSDGQEIRRCMVISSRSAGGWAAIHVQEGGEGIVVEDNIVFASGADIRGNGRSVYEKPFGWGDGISTASRNTNIRNNLIYDVTDEGVMVQGGPGSRVTGNVIASLSREMFGGIALIDPFGYHRIGPEESKTFDYRGVVVEGNWIIALGGRIHSGIPMGGDAWHPNLGGTILLGAQVRDNLLSGKAFGYGYVANGIDGFVVTGNRSTAIHSGKGDGLPGNPPDDPEAFQFNPQAIGGSELQDEFIPAKRHVTKVLRSDRGKGVPADALGYRDIGYPVMEAEAIVEMAFVEMLGRSPLAKESDHWSEWLIKSHANADALRIQLMSMREFTDRFGYVNPLELHNWRDHRWLEMMASVCSDLQQTNAEPWPSAISLHMRLMEALKFK